MRQNSSTGYSESPNPVRSQPLLDRLDPKAVPWRSVRMTSWSLNPPLRTGMFASLCDWHPGLFDPIVRLVADDVLANIMIVDPECRWLLHPYDGGMDVIAESAQARDRLKLSYADWASPSPDVM